MPEASQPSPPRQYMAKGRRRTGTVALPGWSGLCRREGGGEYDRDPRELIAGERNESVARPIRGGVLCSAEGGVYADPESQPRRTSMILISGEALIDLIPDPE